MFTRQLDFKSIHRIKKQRSPYLKNCYSSNHERYMFDEISQPNILSVNHSMLSCLHGNHQPEAFQIFRKQLRFGVTNCVDEVTVALALKACRGDPKPGYQIHGFALSSGFDSYLTVSNSLMNMYCKSGEFDQAYEIFENLNCPDIVSWNTVLSGFQRGQDALRFALRMNVSGVVFDPVSYTSLLSFCSDLQELTFGSQLHSFVVKYGFESDNFVGNAFITMYSRCDHPDEAKKVFDEMPHRDSISWNAMLSGYTQIGNYGSEAIWIFLEMAREGIEMDHVSFSSVIAACAQERNLVLGRQLHGLIFRKGYGIHVSVCNVLLSIYLKCDVLEHANMVFESMIERNVISWTTMISINEEDALLIFNGMRLDGVYPNDVTFVGLIHAISNKSLVKEGQTIHGFCMKTNFVSELNVSNSLITMYSKFESAEEAKKVFDDLDCRNIISWNALISGYAQNGLYQEALHTFLLAALESQPNQFTFGSVLSAIGAAEPVSIKHGQRCHSRIVKLGLNTDPVVSCALLDMYARRGSIYESERVFNEAPQRSRNCQNSQIAWTAIISAHARHGDYESVMSLFHEMEKEGIQPDSITFLTVLTACSRKGMADAGGRIFDSMVNEHQIKPSQEHYSCMVDMLGRVGRLEEAAEFVNQMPNKPGLSVLQSLLGACKMHGNVEMAKRVSETLMEMEPMESGSYVLISNMYAEKGNWDKVAEVRRRMRDKGVKKEVGFSWVDVGDVDGSIYMHGFSSDDKSHPQAEDIYSMAECVGLEMNEREMTLVI